MDTLLIPGEQDFRRWIKEAMSECLQNPSLITNKQERTAGEEPLLSRKEIAAIFRISLVTLHDWMKKGLPFHKQGGRVYFLRSEVMHYFKQTSRQVFKKT